MKLVDINDMVESLNKGSVIANLNINPDLWFFDCHFKEDPVMPGCLGLDAMWQLLRFLSSYGLACQALEEL